MRRTIRVMVMAAVLLAAVPAGALAAGGGAGMAALQAGPAALADFNGDGIDDLVVGVPGEDIDGTVNAGVVDIIYGSESGLAEGTREQLTRALPEAGDRFGAALTPGNFDGNELPDLAVGAPGETVAGRGAAGAVDARDGDDGGLPADPDEPLYFQSNAGVPGTAEAGDIFAAALSA